MKPKVAVVYHFFAHYRQAIITVLAASREFDFVFVGDRSDPDLSIKEASLPVDRFLLAPCRRVFGNVLFQRRILALSFRREFAGVIFLGDAHFVMTWIGALLARMTKKRVLFWTHGWTRNERGFKDTVRRVFYRLAHGLLLYGHRAKQIGINKGFRAEKLYVIYNSLDYDAQRVVRQEITPTELIQLRASLFEDTNTPVIICTARLTPTCQFDLLLQAVSILRQKHHVINVVLVGDGPERERLERLSQANGLKVVLYGACYAERELARLIMAANVTVCPGKVGLTAIQSLAYGTPVVTHDNPDAQGPEYEAVIPGKTGDFFRQNDVVHLSDVIMKWTLDGRIKTDQERQPCYEIIDRLYNPAVQRALIESALQGECVSKRKDMT